MPSLVFRVARCTNYVHAPRLRRFLRTILVLIAIVIVLLVVYRLGWRGGGEQLVVYCAHDAIFSGQVLDAFEQRTGIRVDAAMDNEATKSLGLTRRIIAEAADPRGDVFWNNQMLGTVELAQRGLLEPYKGSGYRRIPDRYKDAQGRYAGFGARLRVYIINTDKMDATESAVQLVLAGDLSQVAAAKPIFGTTLTHYAVLWDAQGGAATKRWRADWLGRGAVEAVSNGMVKDLVARGDCHLGWTDTDDFFVAQHQGKPVAMLPIRAGDGKVICMPNTAAIIKGTKRLDAAKKLVDFLLSQEVELMLARSPSGQIPLGPVDDEQLPPHVRRLREWSADSYNLTGLHQARREVLAWLSTEID